MVNQQQLQHVLRKKSYVRKYVIAFNGPPRAGKDTASGAVCAVIRDRANWMQVRHMKMSDPLKKGAHALFAAFHSPDFYDLPENQHRRTYHVVTSLV
jgi:hypothetical protein